ncbi:MAG TPA: hypothetical protein VFQ39_19545 [Longimicrobium sp.]|nr:hypothetical protein [Longimicrobium sp.]
MPKITIDEFRAGIASPRAGESALLRAYRELARRPDLTALASFSEWPTWPPATAAPSRA